MSHVAEVVYRVTLFQFVEGGGIANLADMVKPAALALLDGGELLAGGSEPLPCRFQVAGRHGGAFGLGRGFGFSGFSIEGGGVEILGDTCREVDAGGVHHRTGGDMVLPSDPHRTSSGPAFQSSAFGRGSAVEGLENGLFGEVGVFSLMFIAEELVIESGSLLCGQP